MSFPNYIYKIVPSSSPIPSPLPDKLPVSQLDQNDGFIHLSTVHQVPRTLERFFSDHDTIYLLRVKYDGVESLIRWESGNGSASGNPGDPDVFPHLYNDLCLGKNEVDSFRTWERDESGWKNAIESSEKDGWFVY
ncbi:hypothetical protein CVT24_003619 [Panaeolus cyanescens]|uniref:DUF952 domain-containing protein n=1 Tax=Panaeolus cyanescens TaxID=181874 RepID=A0A409Y7W8_9AGAR|nr:hypothetical protein CVT24_003619 [Panaeolus cyanescens]